MYTVLWELGIGTGTRGEGNVRTWLLQILFVLTVFPEWTVQGRIHFWVLESCCCLKFCGEINVDECKETGEKETILQLSCYISSIWALLVQEVQFLRRAKSSPSPTSSSLLDNKSTCIIPARQRAVTFLSFSYTTPRLINARDTSTDLWLAYVSGQQGGDVVGDIQASGTHKPGPDWSHYGVLRGCFITGLDSGESLEICCLARCHSERERTQDVPAFDRLCSAAARMLRRQTLKQGDAQDCKFCHCLFTHELTASAEMLVLRHPWSQWSPLYRRIFGILNRRIYREGWVNPGLWLSTDIGVKIQHQCS